MQYHRTQKQFQQASDRDDLNLEGCIQIEQERITRSRVLLDGIRFNLNKDILHRINQAQESGYRLDIAPKLLADWRYYALIDTENRWQSGLTFSTYYRVGESNLVLMRSMIGLDGEIIQQIRSDCLERPKFCRQIAAAHYWLIEQLLSQLPLGRLAKLNQLLKVICWLVALLMLVIMVIAFIPLFLENPWLVLIALAIAGLLQLGLQRLVWLFFPAIRRWVWRQILSGLLSPKPSSKKMAKGMLAWLGS